MIAPAARKDDKIAHSGDVASKPFGAATGLGVGIAAGIIFAVVTAPALPVAILGGIAIANDCAQLGAWIGGIGGWMFPEITCGWISTGASSVKVGADKMDAARIEEDVMCIGGPALASAGALLAFPLGGVVLGVSMLVDMAQGTSHVGARVAEGVLKLTIELKNAARVGCQTTCGATISKGEKSVLYGGALGRLPGYGDTGPISETSGLDSTLRFTDWIGAVATLAAAIVAGSALAIVGGIIGLGAKILGLGYAEDSSGFNGLDDAIEDLKHVKNVKGTIPKVVAAVVILAGGLIVPGTKIGKRTLEGPPSTETIPTIHPTR